MLELKQYNQWILWKNEKGGKVPYSIKGHRASTVNKDHWASYEEVWKEYYKGVGENKYSGVGFVITKEDPFVFVDLDIKSDEDEYLGPLFHKICKKANTYSEFSPSKKGVHIILKSDMDFPAMKTRVIEVYNSGRYMTMTLNKTTTSIDAINSNDELLHHLLSIRDLSWDSVKGFVSAFGAFGAFGSDEKIKASFGVKEKESTGSLVSGSLVSTPVVVGSVGVSGLDDILSIIQRSEKLKDPFNLYANSQDEADQKSPSEADLALMNIIVYFTGDDRELAISIFLSTFRGQRDKCQQREDYLERTFDKAYSGKTNFYSGSVSNGGSGSSSWSDGVFHYDDNGEITFTSGGSFSGGSFSGERVGSGSDYEEDLDLLFSEPKGSEPALSVNPLSEDLQSSLSVNSQPQEKRAEKKEEVFSIFSAEEREKITKYIDDNPEQMEGPIPLVRGLNNSVTAPYTIPDNLLGDIASFLYYRSPMPNKTASLMGAISFMGIVCGNVYSVYGLGLNMYTLLVAPSTFGKNAIHTGIKSILNQVMGYATQHYGGDSELFDMINSLFPKDRVASGPALTNNLSESVSNTYSVNIDEIGEKFAEMKKKTSHAHGVLVTMLEHSESSGLGGLFTGADYASKDNNVKPVQRASINVLATTTPDNFYKEIDINQITNGTINRFVMFDCSKDGFPVLNKHKKNMLSDKLLGQLIELIRYGRMEEKGDLHLSSDDIHTKNTVVEFHESTNENMRLLIANESMMKNKHLKGGDSVKLALIGRKNAQILKLSGLMAISEDFKSPVINNWHLQWAKNIVDYTSNVIEKKFNHGEIGGNQLESEQLQVMRKRLYEAFFEKKPSSTFKKHITNLMHNHKVVSYRFMQQTIGKSIEFRSDRYKKPVEVLEHIIAVCVKSGYLTKIDKDFTITIKKGDKEEKYNQFSFRSLIGVTSRSDLYLIHPSIKTAWVKLGK